MCRRNDKSTAADGDEPRQIPGPQFVYAQHADLFSFLLPLPLAAVLLNFVKKPRYGEIVDLVLGDGEHRRGQVRLACMCVLLLCGAACALGTCGTFYPRVWSALRGAHCSHGCCCCCS